MLNNSCLLQAPQSVIASLLSAKLDCGQDVCTGHHLPGMQDLNDDIINGMIDFAKLVRKAFKNQAMMTTMSVRALLSWGQKIEMMGHIGDALKLSWYNKLDPNEQGVVDDMFFQAFPIYFLNVTV